MLRVALRSAAPDSAGSRCASRAPTGYVEAGRDVRGRVGIAADQPRRRAARRDVTRPLLSRAASSPGRHQPSPAVVSPDADPSDPRHRPGDRCGGRPGAESAHWRRWRLWLRTSSARPSPPSRPSMPQPELAVVTMTTSDEPQYVRVEVLRTVGGLVAQGRIRSGTANDPHVLRIEPGLSPHAVRHIWAHQLSLMTQQLEAAQADRPSGILGRLRSAFGHEGRDHRVRADMAVYQAVQGRQAAREGRPNGPRSVAELEQRHRGPGEGDRTPERYRARTPLGQRRLATADASEPASPPLATPRRPLPRGTRRAISASRSSHRSRRWKPRSRTSRARPRPRRSSAADAPRTRPRSWTRPSPRTCCRTSAHPSGPAACGLTP